jgi:hypothetical protein
LGKGVSNLTQNFNKFFKLEKQKALGNTNKAVKDLNSTPSSFCSKFYGKFQKTGEFRGPNFRGKKEASLVGEAAYIRPLQRKVFWP